MFCCGLYFALRSGKEHRQLHHTPCQIELVEHPGERSFLRYTEDTSKNHQGGLKGRKIQPKVVMHHENLENKQRCFVRLFKLYRSLCPTDAPKHAFYLQPARSPTESCWYSTRPLGHTPLGKTVSRLCKSAGITGYKTNHSLRATSTTRLYQSGVDEQLIMERTGHRSLEGVRSYKRTSNTQRQTLSDILNKPSCSHTVSTNPSPDHINNLHSATLSNQLLQGLTLPDASFHNCSVTFNLGTQATPITSTATATPRKRRRVLIEDDSDTD